LRARWVLAAAQAALLGAAAAPGFVPSPEYQAKVVLLEKLTLFVDWPQARTPDQPFVLAVLGRSPFGDELDAFFAAHPVKGRPVTVRYLARIADLGDCDLLFVCASEAPRLPGILERVKGRPILTVADTEGFAQAGVMVAMVRIGGKIAFEVNLPSVRDAGFRMVPGFLQLVKLFN
jgi:hypothetical protein